MPHPTASGADGKPTKGGKRGKGARLGLYPVGGSW
jgi:hypothetical protein